MKIFGVIGALLVLFALPIAACGNGGTDTGGDCAADTDCGSPLKCFCVTGMPSAPEGYVPGVCSRQCSSKADCADLGDDVSCAKDFCTGVNVCLQGYSGPTLP